MKQDKKLEVPVTGKQSASESNNIGTVIDRLKRADIKSFHLLLVIYGVIIAAGILYRIFS